MSSISKGVVLVIDDEPLKCATLRIELNEAGYTILEACSPSEGIKHLTAQHIDVVVTDLSMPEMNGLQMLERVKAISPATQVILMTASGSIDSAVEAIKRGACDYLVKPFRTEVLIEKLGALKMSQDNVLKEGHERMGEPLDGHKWHQGVNTPPSVDGSPRLDGWPLPENVAGLTEAIAGVERSLIDAALRRAAGNQAKAAQFLGIPRTTLRDKMTKYGMVRESSRRKLAT